MVFNFSCLWKSPIHHNMATFCAITTTYIARKIGAVVYNGLTLVVFHCSFKQSSDFFSLFWDAC